MKISSHLYSEAQECGLTLIKKSIKGNGYFEYRLKCGHLKDMKPHQIRKHEFRCNLCLQKKLTSEAANVGCKILAKPSKHGYRYYQLPCGHQKELTMQHVRENNFRCDTCMNEKLLEEAKSQNCKLLGEGSNSKNRCYLLPCGHTANVHTGDMRYGTFTCRECIHTKHEEEAKEKDLELIGGGRNKAERLYLLPCGHKKFMELKYVRNQHNIACQECTTEKHSKEALARGCTYLGKGKTRAFGKYALGCCSNIQEITIGNMRIGDFVCRECDSSFYNRSSNIYLFSISTPLISFLKLGYSASPDFRKSRYGLPEKASIQLIYNAEIESGELALAMEQKIKKAFAHRCLDKSITRKFMKSGFTECFQMDCKNELESYITELVKGNSLT